MTTDDTTLARLADHRRQMVNARANLRLAEDFWASSKLIAEQHLLVKAGGDPKALGTNEADRRRNLDAAIATDSECAHAIANLRAAQLQVDMLQAEIDVASDARRAREIRLREELLAIATAGNLPTLASVFSS